MSHSHAKKEKEVAPTVVTTPQHTTDTVSGSVPVYAHGQTPVVSMATQHLASGALPPNELIHTELNQTAEYLAERERLNPNKDQSQVLKDVRELVEVANVTLAEKNRGDIAQKFVADVNLVLAKNAGQVSTPDGAKMLTSSQTFITSLRNVLLSAVRSSNFRRIIVDLLRIAKDVFGDIDTTHIHNSFINSGEMTQVSTREATKQTLAAHASNVRQGNVEISQENANQIRADLRELLTELNGHPEGREALRQLLAMSEMVSTEFYANADLAHGDQDIARTYAGAKQLIEAYTGGRSVDIFLMRLRSVVTVAERDAELHLYLQEVRNHLRACLDNPALIESDEYFRQADRLLERGRTFANQYRGEPAVQNLMYEAQVLGDSMRSDPHILLMGEKAANLASHVTYTDKAGNTKLDSDLLPLVRNELIPFLINRIKEVPIKGFQISNEDFEYLIVDDLFLTIDDILPDHVRVRTENDTHVAVQATGGSASRSYIDIQIDGVRVSLKDFYFSFKRRKLIKMIDEGRADLKILGDGVYIRIRYEITNSPTGGLMLSHAHVEARVSRIDFNVLSAKHKGRLNLIAGLFRSRIQTQVSNSLQNKIAEKSVELAEILNSKVLGNMSRERLATLAKTGGAAVSGAKLVN